MTFAPNPALDSVPVAIDGATIGHAVRLGRGYRFFARNSAFRPVERTVYRRLQDVQRAVRAHNAKSAA